MRYTQPGKKPNAILVEASKKDSTKEGLPDSKKPKKVRQTTSCSKVFTKPYIAARQLRSNMEDSEKNGTHNIPDLA
jgi:hypothetical protein